MASLFTSGRYQGFDSAGVPLSGGKLWTYAAGTLTPLATYTTQSGGIENSNPVTLDSAGRAPVWLSSSSYRMILKSSAGSTITDDDNISPYPGETVTFIAAGSGAATRTMQDKARERISVLDFGTPTGTNDDALVTAAFTAAAGKRLYFPGGYTYAVSALTWPANTLFEGDGPTSIIKKRANGDIGTLGALSTVDGLYFDLQGATYSGRCFTIDTGGINLTSWRRWQNCTFADSYSYALEFTAVQAGYLSSADNCFFTMSGPTPYATPAIKLPTANETSGNRHFMSCNSGGFILIDFAGGENTNLVGCLMAPPIYSSTTQKAVISGGRMVNRSDLSAWTIDGSETIIVGNSIAQQLVTFSATLDEAFIDGNSWADTTFTDNAPGDASDNKIYLPSFAYTPVWTGSVSNPAIGNGQLFGSYSRRGEDCRARLTLSVGATTTFGSGYFKFTLPYTPADVVTGTAVLFDNSTGIAHSLPVFVPTGGVNSAILVVSGVGFCTATSPVTLATSDVIYMDLDYRIA